MAEPTLGEVFGNFASQSLTELRIDKADTSTVGLTSSGNNTAEALLVAIILKAATSLTEVARITDIVNRNVTIEYAGQDLINQGGGNVFLRDAYTISLYKPTSVVPIDPDNY